MKKHLVPILSLVIIVIGFSTVYYMQTKENKQSLIKTQPLYVASLKAGIATQNISIDDACKKPQSLNQKTLEVPDTNFDERLKYLCEDQILSRELEAQFGTSSDYKYFLNCAKTYALEMQEMMKDLKDHYPEDYKNLNFKQEDVLLKYLRHPATAYLKAQCESKSEALYWKSISESTKVEDLQFCIQVTSECINGTTKVEDCPANFKVHHDECTKKLNSMRSH